MEHSVIDQGNVHIPYNWIVTSEVDRLNLSLNTTDQFKLCLQLDTGESFRLDNTSPVVWKNTNNELINGGVF